MHAIIARACNYKGMRNAKTGQNATRERRHKGSGAARRLPSGRWQASIIGADGERHKAPQTFDAKMDAESWLAAQVQDLDIGIWSVPKSRTGRGMTLGEFAGDWLAGRNLRPRVRVEYQSLLDNRILPDLGEVPIARINASMVRQWHTNQGTDKPSATAHAYDLLRNILNGAIDDEIIAVNPCRIRGASKARSTKKIKPATIPELATIEQALPERYRAMMVISAWCGVRFGEVTELRRKDVDLDAMQIHILRAVVNVPGIGFIVGETKSEAGVRDIDVPPHIRPALKNHLDQFVGLDPDALLFPAARDPLRHLSQSSRDKVFDRARIVAGRPDLRWHDLRHTGASMSAAAGANLADLKKLMGHSTTDAAMIYQHALDGRGKAIAERLSEMATQTD